VAGGIRDVAELVEWAVGMELIEPRFQCLRINFLLVWKVALISYLVGFFEKSR